ncbi:MAG: hypothetical protein MUC87_01720 [Bacteroidia bacterium]|jgi:hypothetical protein|nr:hypothetical protein [Bacteroidia bacterium]
MSERHRKLDELKQQYKAAYAELAVNQCTIDNCSETPIKAHTLQEGRILKYLKGIGERNQEGVYYLDDHVDYDFKNLKITSLHALNKIDFKPISEASTFYGFCKRHDEVFNQEIENVVFDGSRRMAFYHSFRTFSFGLRKETETMEYLTKKLFLDLESLPVSISSVRTQIDGVVPFLGMISDDFVYSKKEVNQFRQPFDELVDSGYLPNDDVRKNMTEFIGDFFERNSVTGKDIKEFFQKSASRLNTYGEVKQLETLIEQLSNILPPQLFEVKLRRTRLSHIFENKQYEEMTYFIRTLPYVFPVAGSFVAGYLDNILAPFNDGYVVMPRYALTFFPEPSQNRTVFIFGAYRENPNVALFYSRLNVKTDLEFQRFVSKLILLRGTNTFFAPRYWIKLTEEERALILKRKQLKNDTEFGIYDLELNLFQNKLID